MQQRGIAAIRPGHRRGIIVLCILKFRGRPGLAPPAEVVVRRIEPRRDHRRPPGIGHRQQQHQRNNAPSPPQRHHTPQHQQHHQDHQHLQQPLIQHIPQLKPAGQRRIDDHQPGQHRHGPGLAPRHAPPPHRNNPPANRRRKRPPQPRRITHIRKQHTQTVSRPLPLKLIALAKQQNLRIGQQIPPPHRRLVIDQHMHRKRRGHPQHDPRGTIHKRRKPPRPNPRPPPYTPPRRSPPPRTSPSPPATHRHTY